MKFGLVNIKVADICHCSASGVCTYDKSFAKMSNMTLGIVSKLLVQIVKGFGRLGA